MKNNPFALLAIITLAITTFSSCSSPLGYPADYRVYADDNYSVVVVDSSYRTPVEVSGLYAITQHVTCGYACIEMLAKWAGKDITEDSLLETNNGKITTSMGSGFLNEASKQFPEWKITRYVNISNGELLQRVHDSLKNGFPIPIEFAAKDTSGGWTLHFAIVTAMDLGNNKITVQNPYGYEEVYTAEDFIRATRYESYENMEWYFTLGFNMGLFHKNTIYIIETK
jgi:hypothetical protein